MSLINCASSQVMSHLLPWRNSADLDRLFYSSFKIAATEISLVFLTATSIVETVAYAFFASLSLILYPFTKQPLHFSVKFLESSSFTFIWALVDLGYNLFHPHLITSEISARHLADRMHPFSYSVIPRRRQIASGAARTSLPSC